MTAGEARAFASLVDAAVRPGGMLPPVAETDAVAAFGAWLREVPRTNRMALRALLRVIGLRLRRMDAGARDRWLERRASRPELVVLLRLAACCYYGDEAVMRRLGYDASARVARRA